MGSFFKPQNIVPQGEIAQLEHELKAKAKAVTSGILAPGVVMGPNSAAAAIQVKKGSLVRVEVDAAGAYIAFGESNIAAVTSSTTPALKLPQGFHLVRATGEWMRSDVALLRIEVNADENVS